MRLINSCGGEATVRFPQLEMGQKLQGLGDPGKLERP